MNTVYTEDSDDAIKNFVETMMLCLLKCDKNLSEWWRTSGSMDKEIILERLEEEAYVWLSNNGEKNWLL
jgi:hypothetical protein